MQESLTAVESDNTFDKNTLSSLISPFWQESVGYTGLLQALSRAIAQLERQTVIGMREAVELEGLDIAPAYHTYDKYPLRVYLAERDKAGINQVKVRSDDPMRTGYSQVGPYVENYAPAVGGYIPLSQEVAYPISESLLGASNIYTNPSSTEGIPCRVAENSIIFQREHDPFTSEDFFRDEDEKGEYAIIWLGKVQQDRGFPRRFVQWLSGLQGTVTSEQYRVVSACVSLLSRGITENVLDEFVNIASGGSAILARTEAELEQLFPYGVLIPADITGCAAVSLPWDDVDTYVTSEGKIRFSIYGGGSALEDEIWQRFESNMDRLDVGYDQIYTEDAGVEPVGDGYRLSPARYFYRNMLSNKLLFVRIPQSRSNTSTLPGAWKLLEQVGPVSGKLEVFSEVSVTKTTDISFFTGNANAYVYNTVNGVPIDIFGGTGASIISKTLCAGRNLQNDVRNTSGTSCRTCG